MSVDLQARTRAGAELVAIAEELAAAIAPAAAVHDREGTFPYGSLRAVKRRRYLVAPVPAELGGLGVTSVHDLMLASSRLAQGDPALTLGANMHLVFVLNVARRQQLAHAQGDERRAGAFGATLQEIARNGTVFASAGSEPQQDLTHPHTTATRTEDGWIVSGRKIFCTMAPAADIFYTAVTFAEAGGEERYGYAMVPRPTAGVVIHDDWDALGMRASSSHSVSFEDVRLPPSALRGGFPVGDTTEYIDRNLPAGLFHAATALGVAEAAYRAAADLANRIRLDGRAQTLAVEALVDLSACRAMLSHAAMLLDEHVERNPASRGTADELTELFAEVQRAKLFVGDAAARIVDRALALSGGRGYLNGSPLARAYRDVRALPFMHPLGANRAYAFLGKLAAGATPSLGGAGI
jgi:alkylation response protein AidB-like acyl-CoA dehydrogenase